MLKKIFLLISLISYQLFSQVGINTTTPSAGASLDVNSLIGTSQYGGLKLPKVTTAQRNLISVTAAEDGLMIYNTDADGGKRCIQMYNGSSGTWENVQCFSTRAFFESMGNNAPSGTPYPSVVTYASNNYFQNSATCTYSGNTDVRNTNSNTTGSGTANIFFTSSTASTMTFQINGINVSTFTGPLALSVYIRKSTNASDGTGFTVDYFDGSTWTNLPFTMPTGIGTANWHKITLSTNIPNTISGIRFTKDTATAVEFRVDDIEIIKP